MSAYETGRPADVDSDEVASHVQLVEMLERMHADYKGTGKDEWENASLDRYLEALAALADALPHLYENRGEAMPEQPTWEMVAILLAGATGYE